jgi:replicative superfamily II helicase
MAIARDEALRLGRPQTPRKASLLGLDATIPVPVLGPRQSRLAQAEGILPVSADLIGLESYGFPAASIESVRRKLRESNALNDLQIRTISPAGILAGRDVLVRAPTSAGKTLVAELAILHAFHQNLKSVVLVPTRALTSEHARTFRDSYGHLGLGVIRSAGDSSDDDDLLLRGHFDTAVLTYEKFANLVYRDVNVLDGIRTVVLDEIQLIREPERGRTAELLLALLHRRRHRGLPIQLVGLCGDFADLGGLPEWLGAELVAVQTRPVPLRECIVEPSGRMAATWRDGRDIEEGESGVRLDLGGATRLHVARERLADDLIKHLAAAGKQVLVFRTSRARVRSMATRLAEVVSGDHDEGLVAGLDHACQRHEQSRVTGILRGCLSRGVAFHSSELEEHERSFLEQAFRERRIKVLVTTTTLAAGVNMPAHAVVIVDHVFWRGKNIPEEPLDLADYRNMVGRAGRAGQGMTAGEAYLIAGSATERATLTRTYLGDEGNRLEAGLGSMSIDDRTLAAATVVGTGSLLEHVEVLGNTFWGYQHRQDATWRENLRQETDESLERLTDLGLLTRADGRNYSLTQGGAVCAVFGVAVKSAERVLSALDRMIAGTEPVLADELIALAQLSVELDSCYIPDSESDTAREWLSRLGAWGASRPALTQALMTREADAEPERPVRRVKRTALLRNWLSGRPVDEVEAATGGAPDQPSLGFIREIARRTGDILPAVAGLVASRQPDRRAELQRLVEDIRPALEFGVSIGAGGLQRQRLGLTRKLSLLLAQQGITNFEGLQDVLQADPGRLERVLSTPVVNDLRASIQNRSQKRRRTSTPLPEGNLSLFPDGPLA